MLVLYLELGGYDSESCDGGRKQLFSFAACLYRNAFCLASPLTPSWMVTGALLLIVVDPTAHT